MFDVILIVLCAVVVYHHGIFPLILKAKHKKPTARAPASGNFPSITVIVPAYNEEKFIAGKIINTASLNYLKDKLTLLIVCDGCTDGTAKIARETITRHELADCNIQILEFTTNRGKVAVINDAISIAASEIIALSDASAHLNPNSLLRVISHFEDQNAGVVGGTYQFLNHNDYAEETYWRYQRAIKIGEASFGAPLGMHGAFYCFRKSLFKPLAPDTINDDFILPMAIVAQGYKAIYDTSIISTELENTTNSMNWARRIRISSGNVQQAIRLINLLSPKFKGVAFTFFSGKFLRAWMPLILSGIFILTFFSALKSEVYQIFLALQLTGLAIAFLPVKGTHLIAKVIQSCRYLIVGHLAGLVGAYRYLLRLDKTNWKRVR